MILNMIWHVVQDAVKCYFVPLSRRSYIYRPIYFNRTLDYHFLWEPVKFWWGSMFLFFEVFQPQNLFILFLFFLKHSYQTLSKIKHLKYSPVKKKKRFSSSPMYILQFIFAWGKRWFLEIPLLFFSTAPKLVLILRRWYYSDSFWSWQDCLFSCICVS